MVEGCMKREKLTVDGFMEAKKKGRIITMTTAYDYPTAKFVEESGLDAVLIGDSVGPIMLGYKNTIPVTMYDMIHHAKAVVKGAPNLFNVIDMPFMSYEMGGREAVKNALYLIKTTGVDAVKIEGGAEIADIARSIVDAGVPVMGHIGLTPQKISKLGGIKVHGKDRARAKKLVSDAKALEKANVFALILEYVTAEVAKVITNLLSTPTIGIGAGPSCDGQILVITDILGISDKTPPFSKQYANLGGVIIKALKNFIKETKNKEFPSSEHTFHMHQKNSKEFLKYINTER
jgi:3-methyl-2-oxobutanoate hydroxymethyltransferase